MSVIVTVCGRKFECVPGTNLVRDAEKNIQESKLSATDEAIDRTSEFEATGLSLLAWIHRPSDERKVVGNIGALAALATCAAIIATPPHLLRPTSVVPTPASSPLTARIFTSSPDNVASGITAAEQSISITSASDAQSSQKPVFLHESNDPVTS